VDLLEPADGVYPAAQVEALARLLRFLRQDLDLPREGVWDHSELDPYARTNGRGLPWDLSARFPYDQLRALL
jgi:N-acetyl-anhydromuramyl-L-alanine amidase AmpD